MELDGLPQYSDCTLTRNKVKSKNKTKVIVIFTDVFTALWKIWDQAFEKAANGFKPLTIFTKSSILDVRLRS